MPIPSKWQSPESFRQNDEIGNREKLALDRIFEFLKEDTVHAVRLLPAWDRIEVRLNLDPGTTIRLDVGTFLTQKEPTS